MYSELPKPSINVNIGGSNTSPTVNPTACPNAFESLYDCIIPMTITTIFNITPITDVTGFPIPFKIPPINANTTVIQKTDVFHEI